MAELVDALDLGSSGQILAVGVRVSPLACFFEDFSEMVSERSFFIFYLGGVSAWNIMLKNYPL